MTNESRAELAESCARDNDWLLALADMQERVIHRRAEKAAQQADKKRRLFGR